MTQSATLYGAVVSAGAITAEQSAPRFSFKNLNFKEGRLNLLLLALVGLVLLTALALVVLLILRRTTR
jgi:hypothetical protein